MISVHSPKFFVFFLFTSLSLLSHPPLSTAQSEIKSLLNKLDNNYYYPQKNGLTNISAQLTWEQQDTSSEKKFLKKQNFWFKGKLRNHVFEKKITSSPENLNVLGDKKNKHISVLKNYLDIFLPKTLEEKFPNYEGQVKHQQKNKLVIHLTDKAAIGSTKKYELFIDTERWRISKIHIRQNSEPKNITGNFFYTRRGGQWVVAETLSEFTVNDQTYTEKTEYTYKSLQSFWLVNKVKQTIQQDGHLIRSYRFRLNEYKVNLEN